MKLIKTKEDVLALVHGAKFILDTTNGGIATCTLRCSSLSGRWFIRTVQSRSNHSCAFLYLYSGCLSLLRKQALAELVESKRYYFGI